MLVLTRKIGESVIISEEIYCTILGLNDGVIRLAFDAPKSIAIHRAEIQQRIWREAREHKYTVDFLNNKETVVDRLITHLKQTGAQPNIH